MITSSTYSHTHTSLAPRHPAKLAIVGFSANNCNPMASFWMLVASFLFAVMAASVKMASPEIGSFSMIFWRGVFGCISILLWARFTGRSLKTSCFPAHVKRSGIGTLALGMWLYAVAYLPLSTGMTLNYTSPLFIAAFVTGASFFNKSPIQWRLVAATVIGFAGVVEVLQPEFHAGDMFPALVGLGSGLLSAIAYMQIRELSKLNEPDWRVVFYFSVFNLVFGAVTHFLFDQPDVYSAKSVLCIFAAGSSATLAQIALTKSYGTGNLLLSSILSFSAIVFAVIMGMAIFGDPLPLQSALGIAIIIFAGASASFLTKRASSGTSKQPQ